MSNRDPPLITARAFAGHLRIQTGNNKYQSGKKVVMKKRTHWLTVLPVPGLIISFAPSRTNLTFPSTGLSLIVQGHRSSHDSSLPRLRGFKKPSKRPRGLLHVECHNLGTSRLTSTVPLAPIPEDEAKAVA